MKLLFIGWHCFAVAPSAGPLPRASRLLDNIIVVMQLVSSSSATSLGIASSKQAGGWSSSER